MSDYNIRDFINEAEKQEKFYKEQISRFDKLLEDHKQKVEDLQNRKNGILNNITLQFIPEFTEQELNKISQKINSSKLADLFKEYSNEKQLLRKKVEEIEKKDDYIKREALTNPESGVIPSQINEIKPLYEAAKVIYDKINRFPSFKGLRERNYGTNSYPYQGFKKYFIPQFYQDWKNSDRIVEALSAKDFIDVIYQYDQAENQVTALGNSLKDYQEQLKIIEELTKEHDTAAFRLNKLNEIYYKKAGNILYDYFKSIDKTSLQKFFEEKTEYEEEYKKLDGLDHQIDYINQLFEKVTNDRNVLVTRAGKSNEEAQRYKLNEYKYRNKRFSQDQFNSKFSRDESKYDKMYDRYDRYGQTIYGFNDYGRSSLLTDFLWWDLISDGRLDGNFIPEVSEYHSMHPDYTYESVSSSSSSDQS